MRSSVLAVAFFLIASVCAADHKSAYCPSCAKVAYVKSAAYHYNGPIIKRADGTYWLGEVEYERVQRQCNSPEGWCWDYAPKQQQHAAALLQQYQQQGPYAQQGSTVYGVSAFTAQYQHLDHALILDRAGRLAERLIDSQNSAVQNYSALVEGETSRDSRIAEILAKGQVAVQALQAANPQAISAKREFSLRVTQDSDGKVSAAAAPVASQPTVDDAAIGTLLQAKCTKCHNPQKADGQLDLTKFFGLSPEKRNAILSRATHIDPAKRMPKGEDGSPGKPLSLDELKLLFSAQ